MLDVAYEGLIWDKYERPNMVGSVVSLARGGLTVVGAMRSQMKVGQKITIGVEIHNRGEQAWVGDLSRPIKASYHWIDQNGTPVVFDGVRTPVPESGIPPKQVVRVEMAVVAPAVPGRYVLVLTILQERVAWLEEKGFEPARLEVDVR